MKDDSNTVLETYSYGAGREKLIVARATTTNYYVWGGSQIIAEYTLKNSNPLFAKCYIYAGSRLLMTVVNGKGVEYREFHHPDRLGTQLVTDAETGSSYRQTTLPFGSGIPAETTGNTNQVFTSYDRSSTTGLDYAVNRTYSKGQSRFTQVDPIGMASASLGNPQSNNLYAYVQNMPTDFVDPSGLNAGPVSFCIQIISYGHWSNDPSSSVVSTRIICFGGGGYSNTGGNDYGFGGGSGGSGDNPAKPPLFRWKKCKQGKNGADIGEIKQYLRHYGLTQFIDMNTIKMDTVGKDREGITFDFTDAGAAAAYIRNKSNGFNVAGLGGQHNGSVSGGKVSLDARGVQGKGLMPQKSLQVDIGSPDRNNPNKPITGYADLDCDSPVQRPLSHLCKVLGICGG